MSMKKEIVIYAGITIGLVLVAGGTLMAQGDYAKPSVKAKTSHTAKLNKRPTFKQSMENNFEKEYNFAYKNLEHKTLIVNNTFDGDVLTLCWTIGAAKSNAISMQNQKLFDKWSKRRKALGCIGEGQ